mmetsp:Transcript_27968/g.43363  ORF Transcript_27968/g.43363 Transcript_27968/m.43363 type:complete len:311 (-) Transcript_27968:285-1217(-)
MKDIASFEVIKRKSKPPPIQPHCIDIQPDVLPVLVHQFSKIELKGFEHKTKVFLILKTIQQTNTTVLVFRVFVRNKPEHLQLVHRDSLQIFLAHLVDMTKHFDGNVRRLSLLAVASLWRLAINSTEHIGILPHSKTTHQLVTTSLSQQSAGFVQEIPFFILMLFINSTHLWFFGTINLFSQKFVFVEEPTSWRLGRGSVTRVSSLLFLWRFWAFFISVFFFYFLFGSLLFDLFFFFLFFFNFFVLFKHGLSSLSSFFKIVLLSLLSSSYSLKLFLIFLVVIIILNSGGHMFFFFSFRRARVVVRIAVMMV